MLDWTIRVKICRKWRVSAFGPTPESLELLLSDANANRIQASIKCFLIDKFDSMIEEGVVYTIKYFCVVDKARSFPPSENPYIIVFLGDTQVKMEIDNSFPKSIFKFKSFLEIKAGSHRDENPLFDVIGDILDLKMKDDIPGKKKHLEVLLRDAEKNQLQCVLWEPYCGQLKEFVEEVKKTKSPGVMIVQLCRTKIYQGEIGISNTYHATRVIVDQDLDEVMELKSRLPANVGARSYVGTQLSSNSIVSFKDELSNSSTIFMTLEKIKECAMPCKVWVISFISEIIWDKGWFYTSCPVCFRKVADKDAQFFCNHCGCYKIGNSTYRLQFRVVDGTDVATFLMWDRTAQPLIGKSAAVVCQGVVIDSSKDYDIINKEVGSLDHPTVIEKICGRELIFKISVEEKHLRGDKNVYTVDRYCDDHDLIEQYKKTDHMSLVVSDATNVSVGDSKWANGDNNGGFEHDDDFKTPNAKSAKRGWGDTICGTDVKDGEASTSSKRMSLGKDDDANDDQ